MRIPRLAILHGSGRGRRPLQPVARMELTSAWCVAPGEDAALRDRVTTTFFEVYNENDEWRVDDIRREGTSFRDALIAAAPDGARASMLPSMDHVRTRLGITPPLHPGYACLLLAPQDRQSRMDRAKRNPSFFGWTIDGVSLRSTHPT